MLLHITCGTPVAWPGNGKLTAMLSKNIYTQTMSREVDTRLDTSLEVHKQGINIDIQLWYTHNLLPDTDSTLGKNVSMLRTVNL